MGSSFAFYEGTTLIIESRNHADTSERRETFLVTSTVAIEEIEVRDGELHITYTHRDESLFEVPLVHRNIRFAGLRRKMLTSIPARTPIMTGFWN